jgi:NodT family efflux transporter outer membrane factor (OMF) lipoprotein
MIHAMPHSSTRHGGAALGLLRGASALLSAALLAALGACAVGPDYVRPTVETPPAFKEVAGWKLAEPQDQIVRGAWWKVFGDPLLDQLEEQVNVSNQNVAVLEAQYRQSLALVKQARAAYFPTVSVGPSVTRSYRQSPTTTATGPASVYSLPVDVSWEPDLWGQIRRSVESNRAAAQTTAANLEGLRLSTQAQLAQNYLQLRALDAQKQLLDDTVAAYRKSLELTQNRYNAGVVSRGDVLQADTQLKTTQAQAIDVGVQRAQLEHAIAVLIGKPASSFSIAFSPLTGLPPSIPVGVPSELLERRPDVAAAERNMASANAQIGVAVAAYYPNLTLGGSVGYLSSSLSDWLTWPNRSWSAGPSATQTIFDGGLRRARTAAARASYEGAVASYRQTVLTAFQEVEDNLSTLRILEREADMQAAAVAASEQSLAVITNQYKAGTVAYVNVITAQTAVLSNRVSALGVLGRRMTAAVLLIKALGGGWSAADLPRG